MFLSFIIGLACSPGDKPADKTAQKKTQKATENPEKNEEIQAVQPLPDCKADGVIKIRVGWQQTWATQGQLAAILDETEILKELGFDAEFVGFSFGSDLNKGALANKVDVLFTADQPAIKLHSVKNEWGVIGRLMYNRVGTFVPPDSPIKSPKDLAGKVIGIPRGAAAERETLAAVQKAGIDPKSGIEVRDIKPPQLGALVNSGSTNGKWKEYDAGSVWDPLYANLETQGKVRTVASGKVTSVVVMNDNFVSSNKCADINFMKAMNKAYDVYKSDQKSANDRFIKKSSLKGFSHKALDLAASVEPNLKSGGLPIRTRLTTEDELNIQKAADFMLKAGLLKKPVNTKNVTRPISLHK